MRLKTLLISTLVLLVTSYGFGQDIIPASTWWQIDTSIQNKRNLTDTKTRLQQLKQQALASKNYAAAGRCWYDIMSIDDKRTEDTLFFKNALFMDSILNNQQSPLPLKAIIHVLKAKRVEYFAAHMSGRANKLLVASYDSMHDYASMSSDELDSLADEHFKTALQMAGLFTNINVEELLWLSNDPLSFLFKPSFQDVIYSNWIDLRQSHSVYLTGTDWLTLSQDEFMHMPDSAAIFDIKAKRVFGLYKKWMEYNKAANIEAAYCIETFARKYFYQNLPVDSVARRDYERYLQSIIRSKYNTVRAHGIYQLCLRWNSEAINYNPSANQISYYRYAVSSQSKFDTVHRLYYVKALNLFLDNKRLMDSFPVFRNVLEKMSNKIVRPLVQVEIYEKQLPGQPFAAMLYYRNAKKIYTRIVRIRHGEPLPFKKNEKMFYCLQLPAINNTEQTLPYAEDHQLHNAFIKQDGLPAGQYIIQYSDTTLSSDTSRINYIFFEVTNIAVINSDQRVFVLDRTTGFPLQGAGVYVSYKVYSHIDTVKHSKTMTAHKTVNALGYVEVKEKDVESFKVVYNHDTIQTGINTPGSKAPEHVFDKDEYDDMQEYYEDNLQLHIFTDRAIYRPGQAVSYKILCITRDPKTGDPLVLNKQNLHFPFFQKLFAGAAKKLLAKKVLLYLQDPFDRNVDSTTLSFNEFGSFSGSFLIPKTAATGLWMFDVDDSDFDMGYNEGSFRVEEYKRPSFELTLVKPTKELYFTDSFTVKVQVKSFAGAALNSVKIKYAITRSVDIPDKMNMGETINVAGDILKGEAYTDEKGELLLPVNDTLLAGYQFNNNREWKAYYDINATAVDATGESQEESASINLSSKPVRLSIPITAAIDRNEISPLYISASSPFAGAVQKQVEVRLYKMPATKDADVDNDWPSADVWLYNPGDFATWFPGINLGEDIAKEDKQLVWKTNMQAGGDEKLTLPRQLLPAGNYRIEIDAVEHGGVTGQLYKAFQVYDEVANVLPQQTTSFHYMQYNSVEAGKQIKWITGNSLQDVFSIYHVAYYTKTANGLTIKSIYDIKPEKKGVNVWSYTMPRAFGRVEITHLYIMRNHLFRESKEVYITNQYGSLPEITVEQYRKVVAPGSKQIFTISVKTKNENVAAELMTTMYDATLDKLEKHEWQVPRDDNYMRVDTRWDRAINSKIRREREEDIELGYTNAHQQPLWWIMPANYGWINGLKAFDDNISYQLQDKAAGLQIMNTEGLNNVIVTTAFGVKKNLTVSTINIRGLASLNNYKQPLIIVDGAEYTGDLNKLDINSISGIVLKGADATAIYGSRAAEGVLIISTKGPVQIPALPEPPAPVARKNFAETAFFYPHVHAGKDGYYTITFTLPESVTEWKWKMLAHTKKAAFAYAEKSIYTQLPLMVQPAMPRFLYQGDKIFLKSRITNLDTTNLAGTLQCTIEDVVTGADISNSLLGKTKQDFSVSRNSNGAGAFQVTVPQNLQHPLRIKITASTPAFSDGEEHIIPVLSKKIMAAQNIPITLKPLGQTLINTPGLPADAEPYGTALYISPKPGAAMLNALPYLADYPYGCAEQTFNKLLAHTIAIKIMRTDTAMQQMFSHNHATTKDSTLPGALPAELDEQTMPWLQLSHASAIQQQKLLRLLDTVQAQQQIDKYFEIIKTLQNADGGISWFAGGKSDYYISLYLLAGFGKLQTGGLVFLNETNQENFREFLQRLTGYCDNGALLRGADVQYLYARSYWVKRFPLTTPLKQKADSLLIENWQHVNNYSLGEQAALIIATLGYAEKGSVHYTNALQQLESIRQLAIADDGNGTRWKSLSNNDDLNTQTEEWIVKIGEAFEARGQASVVPGIIKWLLQTKQEHNWGTTKATGEVVSLLNRHQPAGTGAALNLQATVNDTAITVTDDLLNGQLAAFNAVQGKAFAASIPVKTSSGQKVTGGIDYYYFTAEPPANKTQDSIAIVKTMYRYDDTAQKWCLIDTSVVLSIADKIKTTLTITARRQLQYVFIEDKHAAALEARDAESGYNYQDGVEYYKSVRDVGMQFFAVKIPSGVTTISYETIVSQTGSFTNGPASLQCMYRPSVHVYSKSSSVHVKK